MLESSAGVLDDVDGVAGLGFAGLADHLNPGILGDALAFVGGGFDGHDGEIERGIRQKEARRIQFELVNRQQFVLGIFLVVELRECARSLSGGFDDMVVGHDEPWPHQKGAAESAADLDAGHRATHGDRQFQKIEVHQIAGADNALLGDLLDGFVRT